ncbi:MAG TPA: Mpo1-like protein [Thermoanaerobaculia bacterium]|nr:Mpo1-like protein [Thermoanaerobaculia bacterium]
MSRLAPMFADYASHHQTVGNKWCHRAGIPLIMFSLIGLLEAVVVISRPEFRLDAALILIAFSTIYYFALDWRFGFLMLVVALAMWAAARQIPLTAHLVLFVAGWILQFIGHGVYEKRQPAFLKNLAHLLIGPLWLLNDAVHWVDAPPAGFDARAASDKI